MIQHAKKERFFEKKEIIIWGFHINVHCSSINSLFSPFSERADSSFLFFLFFFFSFFLFLSLCLFLFFFFFFFFFILC